MSTLLKKIENLPVPILPTMVGAATLSNMYLPLGYTWIRHITMIISTVILLAYIVKIAMYFKTVKKEYSNTVPASLYGGFSMIIMILGSYYFDFSPIIGKALWVIGLTIHTIHIIVFTYRNVIKGFKIDTFVPSWFVTYNGIMVSTVIGGVMNEPGISRIVVYYGIAVLTLILPFMIYRLIKFKINDPVFHTQAIILAPSSLCIVSYLNVIKTPNPIIVYTLYTVVILSIIFVLYRMPKFFSYKFTPAFAGLTFPMAIGIVASVRFSAFLITQGYESFANIIKELAGIQIYLTTAIIVFVLYNFASMLINSYRKIDY